MNIQKKRVSILKEVDKHQKKKNHFAEKILEIAKQNNIPLKDDPEMMKILLKLDLGEEVPPELYKVVTKILAFVYRVSQKEYSEGIN